MAFESNIFGYSRHSVWERYSHVIQNLDEGLFLIVCDESASDLVLDALKKTALSLGYKDRDLTIVWVCNSSPSLSPSDLFEIIEGIDPRCIVLASESALRLFNDAYRLSLSTETSFRAFCRDIRALPTLGSLLESQEGKQKAWSILKTLPKA